MALIQDGWNTRKTKLSDEFGFEEYRAQHSEAVVLFAVDPKGRVTFPVGDEDFEPRPGWIISELSPASDKKTDSK